MTLQEIKELVSKKIAEQGSQVDIGGALAEILNGIVDAVESANSVLSLSFSNPTYNISEEEMAAYIGCSIKDFHRLVNGKISFVNGKVTNESYIVLYQEDSIKFYGYSEAVAYPQAFWVLSNSENKWSLLEV